MLVVVVVVEVEESKVSGPRVRKKEWPSSTSSVSSPDARDRQPTDWNPDGANESVAYGSTY